MTLTCENTRSVLSRAHRRVFVGVIVLIPSRTAGTILNEVYACLRAYTALAGVMV